MDHQGSHHDNCASLTPEEVYLRTTPDARLTVHLVLVLVEAALGHQHAPAKRTFPTSRLTKHHQGREVEVPNVLQDLQKPRTLGSMAKAIRTPSEPAHLQKTTVEELAALGSEANQRFAKLLCLPK